MAIGNAPADDVSGASATTSKKWEKVVDKEEICSEKLAYSWAAAAEQRRVGRIDIGESQDAFVLTDVLAAGECEFLISATEEAGYTFWDTSANPSSDFRSAWTCEVTNTALAAAVWERVKDHVVLEITFDNEDDERFERDLRGTWVACGVNENLLFARYSDGGHFGPHSDGCTVVDINHRSLFPLLLYLNTPEGGGETVIIKDEQRECPIPTDAQGRYTARDDLVIERVPAVRGRALCFYQTQMHEGAAVAEGAEKYVIRSDVMYRRKDPILTSPEDREAFALWQEAQLLAEKGEIEEAQRKFRRCFKLSRGLAELYGM
ncbi:unnamed protein product [Vitrella brassicaformis CCMP3155]|uniref:Fe2OG dioxygenase domain-containing protein n=1 Tax=Vitrella brassicaformis (strain CCMP3155) TaxID=1169540 RepID=A0A0G4EYK1_VITBC|nr:unnamed protein product [Vitrella brassicaformis CCMP3155]|eukprot:CEM04133.1 unnamed protein product [Vitrella brassicaformis CCMP3155]